MNPRAKFRLNIVAAEQLPEEVTGELLLAINGILERWGFNVSLATTPDAMLIYARHRGDGEASA